MPLLDDMGAIRHGAVPIIQVFRDGSEVWPKTPVTLTATGIDWDQISLTITPPSIAVDGYVLRRDGTQLPLGAGLTFVDTALNPSTTYSYTVDAVKGSTVVSTGAASATTQARAGMGLTGSSPRWDLIDLSWTDPSGRVTEYHLYRSGVAEAIYKGPLKTFQDSLLVPSKWYGYTLYAVRSGVSVGTAQYIDVATIARTAPTISLSSFNLTYQCVRITWTDATQGSIDWYELWRRPENDVNAWSLLESEPASDKARDECGLAASTTYRYLVRSFRGGKPPPNGTGVQIGGDAEKTITTAARPTSTGTARSGMKTPEGDKVQSGVGFTSATRRQLTGNDMHLPYDCQVTSFQAVVYGHGQNARCEPLVKGVSMGNGWIFNSTRRWNTFNFGGGCWHGAGTAKTAVIVGGTTGYRTHDGCRGAGGNQPISGWGYAEWSAWVPQRWDYYVATDYLTYWYYTARSDDPVGLENHRALPWWNEILLDRDTHTDSWSDTETGELTSARITDKETGEVLIEWGDPPESGSPPELPVPKQPSDTQ